MSEPTRILLEEHEIPTHWYNIAADLSTPPAPPLGPDGKPVDPSAMAAIFPEPILEQEMSRERWIAIPETVRETYAIWRPSPLMRAVRLERRLGTPAKIFFKYEGVSPAGSHKPNSAVPQAYYNRQVGIKRLTTETGAGQWGSSIAFAGQMFGLEVRVYMVRVSYQQKPYRRALMETWGAEVHASPSPLTETGRRILATEPDHPGSLGIAISEAVEEAASRPDTNYTLGSVLNHVLLHQSLIGLEAKKQFEKIGRYPDVVIGCAGGGSNFGGVSLPFVRDKINGKQVSIIASEPASCPTLTKGPFAYDFGDVAKMTPLLPMHTLGHDFIPESIHAGGLRYHGMAPIVSHVVQQKLVEPRAYNQIETFEAGVLWARTEGFIPAPETNHAIAAVVDEARRAKQEGKEKTILFCYSGHGIIDLASYDNYLSGKLEPHELPNGEIQRALKAIESHPKCIGR